MEMKKKKMVKRIKQNTEETENKSRREVEK